MKDGDAANKKYVDSKDVDLSLYVKRDGSQSMTGNLQMGSKKITNLADPDQDNEAVNKGYLDRELATKVLTDYLKRDGSQTMTGDLNMDKNYIEDLETPNDIPITELVNYRKDAYRPLIMNISEKTS